MGASLSANSVRGNDWQLPDHQGTIRDIADSSGALAKHIDYDSFRRIDTETFYGVAHLLFDQAFYFQGQERDQVTGWQKHGKRWYIPDMGRFVSEDPIAADVNLYRYALNNPVLYVDPTGLYTQLPTSYLPAFGNTTGFGRGSASNTALDLAYSNFNAPSTTSTWNAFGNALGNAAYSAANSYFGPVRQTAVGAGVAFASSLPIVGQVNGAAGDGYVRELGGERIVPTRPEDLPLYIQRARSDSYQLPVVSHQGQGYFVPGRDGSVRFVNDEAALPIATRQRQAANAANDARNRAAFLTATQEAAIAISPIHETARDIGVAGFNYDYAEPNHRFSPEERVYATGFLFMPGGNSGQVRRGQQVVDYLTPRAYDVGLANELRTNSLLGTQVHHVPQSRQAESLIGDFNLRNRVGNEPGIRLPISEHEAVNAAQRLRTAPASARDLLADEIRILRNNTNAPNSALQELIERGRGLHRYDYEPLHRVRQ
jgi:RHS repeat-associated protein